MVFEKNTKETLVISGDVSVVIPGPTANLHARPSIRTLHEDTTSLFPPLIYLVSTYMDVSCIVFFCAHLLIELRHLHHWLIIFATLYNHSKVRII